MAFALLELPLELTCHILNFLSFKDLLNCATVCKHLQIAIKQSACLQYIIELAYHQMIPLSSSTETSCAVRRKHLSCRELAWKKLKWSEKHHVSRGFPGFMYDFVDGLYGVGCSTEEGHLSESIMFYRLPPLDDSPTETSWTHDFNMPILDFAMDPSQDLLVLLTIAPRESIFLYRIYLRTISTNQPHPETVTDHLPFFLGRNTGHEGDAFHAYRLRILGDLIGIMAKEAIDSPGSLEIWNWKYGPHHSRSITHATGIEDFCFLSPTALLLSEPEGLFKVFTFTNPDSSACANPILRAVFALPPLRSSHFYLYHTINCNPSPGHVPSRSSDSPFARHDRTYFMDPEERIIGCALATMDQHAHVGDLVTHTIDCFTFFVNLHIFLDVLKTDPPSISATEEGVEGKISPAVFIPWQKWGPKNTRWFEDSLSTNWQHAIFGFRTVERVPYEVSSTEQGLKKSRLRVRDFNPHAVGIAASCQEAADEQGSRTVSGTSILRAADVFLEDIESALPFREILTTELLVVNEIMMDECRILLLRDGPKGSADILQF